MPDISITVTDKRPVCTAGTTVVCDNSDYIVHWDLDAEWSAYDTKTMRVIYMDSTYADIVFAGDSVALPPVPVPGCVQIGLYAGDVHTSRMALLRALSSVRSASGAPANPTPDVYDQLMELIKGLGGVDPDDIAKAVADYLAANPIKETDPTVPEWAKADITGATVGQIAKIAAVDASGVPTAWSPVDMPSGGGETWEKLVDVTLAEDVASVTYTFDNCKSISALIVPAILDGESIEGWKNITINNVLYPALSTVMRPYQALCFRVNAVRPPYMEANLNFSRNLSVLGINGGSYTAVLGNIAPEGVSEFGCQTARLLKKGTKIEIWGVKS